MDWARVRNENKMKRTQKVAGQDLGLGKLPTPGVAKHDGKSCKVCSNQILKGNKIVKLRSDTIHKGCFQWG